jgi:hypothetical protein
MSYDLTFTGMSDALDAWERIVERALAILDDAEAARTDTYGEIDDPGTGIQLRIDNETGTISVPYRHFTAPAEVIVKLYELAEIVRQEAGLTGYDPQVGRPVREDDVGLAVTAYASVAAMFERRARTEARLAARRAEREQA